MRRPSDSIAWRWKMTESTRPSSTSTSSKPTSDSSSHEMEEYAGGYIKAWHGHIPAWLLVVYAVLFIWALFSLFNYLGGPGPRRIGCRCATAKGVASRR